MKRMVCEMCGGTDLIKQDGVFVCQSCGTKYSVEDARKMMVEIEGTVNVTGTVKVDNSAAIENYLQMARNALEASNHTEAESYANKIIELEPQNSEAWEIKGEAAGWLSTTANNRLTEAVTAWLNAIKYASAGEVSALRERIAGKYVGLLVAMITLRAQNFGQIQDDDRRKGLTGDLDTGTQLMNSLTIEGGVSFNRAIAYELVARQMNEGAMAGYRDACSNFGPEHNNMAKWQWNRFTSNCDNCIRVLERAGALARSESQGRTIYSNMISIGQAARDSASWKFNVNSWNADKYDKDFSFTDAAKNTRTKSIDSYKEKLKRFDIDLAGQVMARLERQREETEVRDGIRKYWEEHPEEKARLDAETEKLNSRAAELEEQARQLPVQGEIKALSGELDSIRRQLTSLRSRLGSLGMFKGKEKRTLQEQIDALSAQRKEKEAELVQCKEKAAEQSKPLQDESAAVQNRIKEIQAEFNKSRERLSVTGQFTIDGAIRDGRFTISVEQLVRHMETLLPEPYVLSAPKKFALGLHASFQDAWQIIVQDKTKKTKDGKPESTGVLFYAAARELTDPIRTLVISTASNNTGTASWMSAFCRLGALLMMSLSAELSLPQAEQMMCDMMLSETNSRFETGELTAEYADHNMNVLGVANLHFSDILIRPKQ